MFNILSDACFKFQSTKKRVEGEEEEEEALYPQNERPIYLDQSVLLVNRHSYTFSPMSFMRPTWIGTLNIQAIICNDRCRVTFHFKHTKKKNLLTSKFFVLGETKKKPKPKVKENKANEGR